MQKTKPYSGFRTSPIPSTYCESYLYQSLRPIDTYFPKFSSRELFEDVLRRIPNAKDVSCPFDKLPSVQIGPIIIWVLNECEFLELIGRKYRFIVDIYSFRTPGKSQSIAVSNTRVLVKLTKCVQTIGRI